MPECVGLITASLPFVTPLTIAPGWTPWGLLPNGFLGVLDMMWQRCLHQFRKFSDLVISDSHGALNGRLRTSSSKAWTLPWTSDPITKLHYLFSETFWSRVVQMLYDGEGEEDNKNRQGTIHPLLEAHFFHHSV